MEINVVFMGSPNFALPSLENLAKHYHLKGVVTQPDRPAGRGKILTAPPVKTLAISLGIPVIQPLRLKDEGVFEELLVWKPDLIVVAAYGQLLRQKVLELPKYGCINVHASLLPRWRGASPIFAAIYHGDPKTGVSIMKMEAGLDTGPILSQREVSISDEDNAGSLERKLAALGSDLLIETLPGYISGGIAPILQDSKRATYAPILKKEDGEINTQKSTEELVRQARASNPWPGCFTYLDGSVFKIHKAHASSGKNCSPGNRSVIDDLPAISTSDGWLVLDEVQPAGKKPMDGKVFLFGARSWETPCKPT